MTFIAVNTIQSGHTPLTIMTNAARFTTGQIVATPGALELLHKHGVSPVSLIARHIQGEWGDCHPDDAVLNEQAIQDGSRIMSVYRLVNQELIDETPRHKRSDLPTIWCITDATNEMGIRDVSTLLLPQDY